MSRLILVRHASAGSRERWAGDDRFRPLDERGRAQAETLVGALSGHPIDRICSSPYVRCIDSVEPLARERGLELEERDELGEGAAPPEVYALLDELAEVIGLLCTHGDVALMLTGEHMKKGAVSVLEWRNGKIVGVERIRLPV